MDHTALSATVAQTLFIGIDLHSTNAVIHVRRNGVNTMGQISGECVWSGKVSIVNGPQALVKKLSKYCDDQPHLAVVESTYNWYFLADVFEEHGWQLHIADPATVSQANIKASDDHTDAEYLAERLRCNSIKHYAPLDKSSRALRDMCRLRMDFVQRRANCKIRIVNQYRNQLSLKMSADALFKRVHENLSETLELDPALIEEFTDANTRLEIALELEQIALLNRQIEKLEAQIHAQCKGHALLSLSKTIPGCGPVYGSIVATEIGSISRFNRDKNFVSYCRLCPTSKISNGKSKGHANAKNGNPYLSWVFTEIATHCVRVCPGAKKLFDKLMNKYGGLRVKAIRTVAAKIARALWHMAKTGEAFNAKRCFC